MQTHLENHTEFGKSKSIGEHQDKGKGRIIKQSGCQAFIMKVTGNY